MATPSPAPARIFMILLPCALAFLASFCIMVIELVAGRLIARHVGASLYTWTSVIGIILGGMTVGNLFGGRLADRFDTRKLVSGLFFLAAITCAAIPFLNDVVGEAELFETRSWPFRIAVHVFLVFFLPAAALGFIGPAVAKMALDQGRETGRTVGNVYAWGALGSIAGTFLTGFYLVANVGSKATMFGAAIFLALVGLAMAPWSSRALALIFIPTFILFAEERAQGTWEWQFAGNWPFIDWPFVKEKTKGDAIYIDESAYSYVKVSEDKSENHRELILDNLIHAYLPEDITKLDYEYEEIYAAITRRYAGDRQGVRALFLGGGGYIFPRYLRAIWPESSIEVAEIDPGVTRAVMSHFRLRREDVRIAGDEGFFQSVTEGAAGDDSEEEGGPPGKDGPPQVRKPIVIHHLDARNRVEDLWRAKQSGAGFEPFDFIYGDAFNDYSVPYHLVTREFNEKLRDILRPETGIYLINIIDIYDYGRFLGAVHQTMRTVFPRVYVIATNDGGPNEDWDGRDTFIVVGAFRDLDVKELSGDEGKEIDASLLEEEHLKRLEERCGGVVLSDDYSPVENMLGEVVRRNNEPQPEKEREEEEEENGEGEGGA